MSVFVRLATPEDAAVMRDLINPIIADGTTTAHRRPFDVSRIQSHYIASPRSVSCFTAWDGDILLGFQSVDFGNPDDDGPFAIPPGWGEVGSFVSTKARGLGVGRALFAATLEQARQARLVAIDATIRADNKPGLGFYSALGFMDYARIEGLTLSDGTTVARIRKRYDMTAHV